MASYVEYQLDDGTILLIEGDEAEASSMVRVSSDSDGNVIKKAGTRFEQALAGVKKSAQFLQAQLHDLKADEVEVVFGLKVVGEGNFAVVKSRVEANYEVTLKWKKQQTP